MKNKIVNNIIIGIMIFLSIPTTAILASNNAIPGDQLYPVKTTLEKIASMFSSPSYQLHSELEIQLIQRRIEENQALLLNSGSTKGLSLLVAQAEAAKEYILNSNTSQKTKTQAVNRLVGVLQESQQKLEEQKQNIASTSTTNTVYVYVKNPTISQGNSSEKSSNYSEESVSDSEETTSEYEEESADSEETTSEYEEESVSDSEETTYEYEEENTSNSEGVYDEIDETNDEIDDIIDDLTNTDLTQNVDTSSTTTNEDDTSTTTTNEDESGSEQNQITNCSQSCNVAGLENGRCKSSQSCPESYIHNTSGDQFCLQNKICCCK